MLLEVQEKWRAYRSAHCAWQAPTEESVSIRPTLEATCMTSLTWDRIDELNVNLCERRGLTGECEASRRYARPQAINSAKATASALFSK